MNGKFIRGFGLLTVTICGVLTSQATIIDRGNYLHDSRTGLAFLDLSQSTGYSNQQVLNELALGGDFVGHRYASVNEVESLIRNFGLTDDFFSLRNGLPEEIALFESFFDTGMQTFSGRTPGSLFTTRQAAGVTNEVVPIFGGLQTPLVQLRDLDFGDDIQIGFVGVQSFSDDSSSALGHWLVLASTPIGYSESSPLLPTSSTVQGSKLFDGVDGMGNWFDPEASPAYFFDVTDGLSLFTGVGMPTSSSDTDQMFTLDDGLNAPVELAAGDDYVFPTPVSSFTIGGIDLLDENEDFAAFVQLDQQTVSFSMTGIPEPSSLELVGFGVICFLYRRRRKA